MITRYQKQLREGYDVPDSKYERWLLVYHPDIYKGILLPINNYAYMIIRCL